MCNEKLNYLQKSLLNRLSIVHGRITLTNRLSIVHGRITLTNRLSIVHGRITLLSHAPGIIAPSARLEIRGGREEWLRDLPQICFIK